MTENISYYGDEESSQWDDRAQNVTAVYREKYQQENLTKKVTQIYKKSNEVVEIAFQTAAQLVVMILTPEITPMLKYLLGKTSMPVPSFLNIYVAAFTSKMLVDVGIWFNFKLLSWMPRPDRSELIQPWNPLNLEINGFSTLVGIGLGFLSTSLGRSIENTHYTIMNKFFDKLIHLVFVKMLRSRETELPSIAAKSIQGLITLQRFVYRNMLGTILKHIPLCGTVVCAPLVAENLMCLGQEAQRKNKMIASCAVSRLYLQFKRIPDCFEWKEVPGIIIPRDMICPITHLLFVDPVEISGMIFERSAAWIWITKTKKHPMLDEPCDLENIRDAPEMKKLIKEFTLAHNIQLITKNTGSTVDVGVLNKIPQ